MTYENIVDMRGIVKEFPGVKAVKDVNFSVKSGEIRALVGENGAGKSTLVKILSGCFPRSTYKGEIYIEGEKVTINTAIDSEAYKISMIPQEIKLIQEITVAENIFLNHQPTKFGVIDWDELYKNAKEEINKLNIDLDVQTPVKNYSIAIQGLISIAKALSKNIKILILDEPTAFLTEEEIKILFRILRELKSNNITCIFISHKLSEIFQLCDSVYCYFFPHMVGTKKVGEINQEDVIETMLGTTIENMYPKTPSKIGKEVLEIKNFSVLDSKSKRNIVNNVNFVAHRDEVLGIFGLVGSGRTELIMSMFGMTPKNLYSGDILINNKKIRVNSPFDIINKGIGFITEDRQKYGLFLDFNISFNISIGNLEKIVSANLIDEYKEFNLSQEYVDKLNIKISSLKMIAKQLSGGNQQKVIVARWLAKNLNVLILDEPTKGIDVGSKVEIYKLINEMSKYMAIIFISSELPEILGMSDRILVMHRGTIKGELPRSQADEKKILNLATGGLNI
ncbi:MAG: sugar ABC transporter ATP-binding protein [Actinobacteria bacterium]|nr:sugar ABC transporter ATP-binding protein [Actinomycetota bacterium]